MRAIGLITLLVFSTFIKPSLAQPHHFRKGVVEKITVTDSNLTRELAEAQVGPTTPGTVYVVTVRSGASVYSGEFRIEHDSDYPSTLRLRQTVRFRAAQVQFTACDIHNVMTLMTLHYLFCETSAAEIGSSTCPAFLLTSTPTSQVRSSNSCCEISIPLRISD